MDKIINAVSQINKIYGDTGSMEGTYKHFLDIKHEAEYLEKENVKLKKAIEILKGKGLILKHYPNSKNHEFVFQFIGWEYMFENLTPYEYELLKEVLENDKDN